MAMSDKHVQEFKEIYEKKKGEPVSDEEAREGAESLYRLFEILWDGAREDQARKNRLKKAPDGFELEGSYSCCVCRNTAHGVNHLFTKLGINCKDCYRALKDGTIPTYVAQNRDSYFLDWQLKSEFDIHPATVRKYVKDGTLKARIVRDENGRSHEHIFLKRENPALVQKYNPVRKSYNRNRAKVAAAWGRKAKAEWREEKKKLEKKWKK
jgi:hypothetical protein